MIICFDLNNKWFRVGEIVWVCYMFLFVKNVLCCLYEKIFVSVGNGRRRGGRYKYGGGVYIIDRFLLRRIDNYIKMERW